MKVVTWTLEMLQPPASVARPVPEGARLERVESMTPEYARFLYGLVGGPWHWTDRLNWTRQQWVDELSVAGAEFWVLYGGGAPWGYVHLHPMIGDHGTQVEIRYFGLTQQAMGRGLGGRLLEAGIAAAWSMPERVRVPSVSRVWVHTCTLDGPAAVANYQARGLKIIETKETEETVAGEPLGTWVSTGGPSHNAR